FRRQINSIKNQTYRDWVCFISDDGSGVEHQSTIREFCGDDDRFKISFFNQNHGFYHNFERGLRSLEGKFDFVALSDQDDYWYPEKLQGLVDEMDDKTSLVYSDMRIVTDSGDLISETYWRNRKNNYQRLDVLMSANTVTGAATLFRAEMLEKILPFPKKIGDAFHDHWIAIVGITQGELKYINAPLYDYYQHTENIIGHVDFGRSKKHTVNPPDRSKRHSKKLSYASVQGVAYLKKPSKKRPLKLMLRAFILKIIQLKWIYLHLRAFFLEISVNQCRSLEVMSETIKLRDDRIKSNRKLSPLFAYGKGVMSAVKLLKGFFIAKMMGYTTANRDLYMALGYLFYSIDLVKLGYHFKQLLLKLNLIRNQQ
ncbi:MAG: glycosyltransferase, partial [Arenicellales bacterium]|nr:glycosyltransferase [Arenicellales bacterium]